MGIFIYNAINDKQNYKSTGEKVNEENLKALIQSVWMLKILQVEFIFTRLVQVNLTK